MFNKELLLAGSGVDMETIVKESYFVTNGTLNSKYSGLELYTPLGVWIGPKYSINNKSTSANFGTVSFISSLDFSKYLKAIYAYRDYMITFTAIDANRTYISFEPEVFGHFPRGTYTFYGYATPDSP